MPATLSRDDIVMRHLPLAASKTNAFLRRSPQYQFLEDDLHAEAQLAVVRAANHIVEHGADNDREYVATAIERALTDYASTAAAVGPSAATQRRLRAKGETIVAPKQETLQEASYDSRREDDLRDELEACCLDDVDREILRLREEGYRDREIGETLCLSTSAIHARRQSIEERFDAARVSDNDEKLAGVKTR